MMGTELRKMERRFLGEEFTYAGTVGSMEICPNTKGVYLITCEKDFNPQFMEKSHAGKRKKEGELKDPTIPVAELKSNWVNNAEILYIGESGNIAERIAEHIYFWNGNDYYHAWGGRLIAQLENYKELQVWFLECEDGEKKSDLIDKFKKQYEGKLPFANLCDRSPQKTGNKNRNRLRVYLFILVLLYSVSACPSIFPVSPIEIDAGILFTVFGLIFGFAATAITFFAGFGWSKQDNGSVKKSVLSVLLTPESKIWFIDAYLILLIDLFWGIYFFVCGKTYQLLLLTFISGVQTFIIFHYYLKEFFNANRGKNDKANRGKNDKANRDENDNKTDELKSRKKWWTILDWGFLLTPIILLLVHMKAYLFVWPALVVVAAHIIFVAAHGVLKEKFIEDKK